MPRKRKYPHRVQWWVIWVNGKGRRVWYEPNLPLLLKVYRKWDSEARVTGPHVREW